VLASVIGSVLLPDWHLMFLVLGVAVVAPLCWMLLAARFLAGLGLGGVAIATSTLVASIIGTWSSWSTSGS